jgi:hypothetical protein
LLALHVTPADEQDRAQVGELARQAQQITEENVELAYVFYVAREGLGVVANKLPENSANLP